MHSSVHYRESKGKGFPHFHSKPKLVEARCRYGRVGYAPSLLFSYTMPGTLCYNHKNLSSTLSILLDVVSRFALYRGADSLSHSKRKCISIHVFSPECNVQLGLYARCPGCERRASGLYDVEQRLSVVERTASFYQGLLR